MNGNNILREPKTNLKLISPKSQENLIMSASFNVKFNFRFEISEIQLQICMADTNVNSRTFSQPESLFGMSVTNFEILRISNGESAYLVSV